MWLARTTQIHRRGTPIRSRTSYCALSADGGGGMRWRCLKARQEWLKVVSRRKRWSSEQQPEMKQGEKQKRKQHP